MTQLKGFKMRNKMSSSVVLGFSFALLGGFASLVKAETPAPVPAPKAEQSAPALNQTSEHPMLEKQKMLRMKMQQAAKRRAVGSYRDLNLTKDQRQKISVLKKEMRTELRMVMMNLNRLGTEMRMLATSESFNEAKAKTLANEQGKYAAKLFFMQAQMEHRMFMILDATQKEKIKAMYKARAEKIGMGMPKKAPVPAPKKSEH